MYNIQDAKQEKINKAVEGFMNDYNTYKEKYGEVEKFER